MRPEFFAAALLLSPTPTGLPDSRDPASVIRLQRGTNALEGADVQACISPNNRFEIGGILNPETRLDGLRALSSMGAYFAEKDIGNSRKRRARELQYHASLAHCHVYDLAAASVDASLFYPSTTEPGGELARERSFVFGEIRRLIDTHTQARLRDGA